MGEPVIAVHVLHVPGTRPRPTALLDAMAPFRPEVADDPERRGPWWNVRRCLEAPRPQGTTHVLILNDDVLPTPGVVESVRAVAAFGRKTFVTLFSYHAQLARARDLGVNWIRSSTFAWGCAQLIPVSLIEPFLRFNDEFVRDDWDIDDTRWVLFACWRREPNYIFAPSLFDHPPQLESVHMPGKQHRQTEWLASGPVRVGHAELVPAEQDPATYLLTRKHRFKKYPIF
jgi:hypothetical protein